jgi:alpha-methylacyl-CoA racemase
VIVEQFRPGVMNRLGLGFRDACGLNPRIVYCSITGFGQDGPDAQTAAHDLNYQARTGLLALTCDATGAPGMPPMLAADLAAGAYPAVINILLALRQRDLDGQPRHLDVSMTDNLFALMYWGLGNGWAGGRWPRAGEELVTGGSARYRIYRTADGAYLAAAPLEERFWRTFVDSIGLPELADADPMQDVRAQVAERIAQQPLAYWRERFAGLDVCVSEVVGLEQAVQDPHFVQRGLFRRTVSTRTDARTTALPTPVDPQFLAEAADAATPALGQHDAEVFGR